MSINILAILSVIILNNQLNSLDFKKLIPNENKLKTTDTVSIGNQIWAAKNLNISTFRNGDIIPEAKTDEAWENAGLLEQPVWCYYQNDPRNGFIFGKLYNWYAITDPRGIAPEGWKVPNRYQMIELINYLGGMSEAGKKLKHKIFWPKETIIEDGTKYNALPGGYRYDDGRFFDINNYGFWWLNDNIKNESTGIAFYLNKKNGKIEIDESLKQMGFSVRLIKE